MRLLVIYTLIFGIYVYSGGCFEWESLLEPTLYRHYHNITFWSIFHWKAELFWNNMIQDDLQYVYYSETSSTFPYFDSMVALRYPHFHQHDYQIVNFTQHEAQSLFQTSKSTRNGHNRYHAYYSGNILQPAFKQVVNDVDLSSIVDHNLLNRITALIWMGSEDVTASPHYDSVNNIYIQLYGRKTIRLRPPADIAALHVCGRYHPYACQTRAVTLDYQSSYDRRYFQRSFRLLDSLPDATSKFGIDDAKSEHDVMIFTLNPGDVLYIPAYWFHETIAESTSASISLWWDSAVWDVMDQVYAPPIPIEDSWSLSQKICAVLRFIETVLLSIDRQLDDEHKISYDVKSLLKARYVEDMMAYDQAKAATNLVISAICPACDDVDICFISSYDDYDMEMKVVIAGQRLADVFVEIVRLHGMTYGNAIAVLSIKIADYVEDMLDFVDPHHPTVLYLIYWLIR